MGKGEFTFALRARCLLTLYGIVEVALLGLLVKELVRGKNLHHRGNRQEQNLLHQQSSKLLSLISCFLKNAILENILDGLNLCH